MSMAKTLRRKLQDAFQPVVLEIEDDSHHHAGHAGWRPGGETHFRVRLRANAFEGVSRVARHRLVHDVLAQELQGAIHALELDLGGPHDR
ncbi:MAG: BolA family transcriptional regulator [Alphaproteobacteria bacterium]|nr:BolA family transcriptional regulator [Alphaproteobacteria bacterium]